MSSSNSKQMIGDYEIICQVGEGSFGKAYRVRKVNTSEDFVIKKIEKKKIEASKLKSYFETEILIMKSIDHPRILHAVEVLQSSKLYFLVTNFCNGGDLKTKMKQFPLGLEEQEAVRYLKEILEGYVELKKRIILHRDMKLENILLHNGSVVIADFGYAKRDEENSTIFENLNRSSIIADSFVGTPSTMAPEILQNTLESYNHKADLWSIGVIFYELLFGYNIFLDIKQSKIIEKMRKFSGNSLTFPKLVSKHSQDFLRGILQFDPSQRFDLNACINHPLFKNSLSVSSFIEKSNFSNQPNNLLSRINNPNILSSSKVVPELISPEDELGIVLKDDDPDEIFYDKLSRNIDFLTLFDRLKEDIQEVLLKTPSGFLKSKVNHLYIVLILKAILMNRTIIEKLKSRKSESWILDYFAFSKRISGLSDCEKLEKLFSSEFDKALNDSDDLMSREETFSLRFSHRTVKEIDKMIEVLLKELKESYISSTFSSDFGKCFGIFLCKSIFCLKNEKMVENLDHKTKLHKYAFYLCGGLGSINQAEILKFLFKEI